MVIETLFVGRNNTFSLILIRGGVPISLNAIVGYELHLANGKVFNDLSRFVEKEDGIVEIAIGDLLTEEDIGTHKTYLVTYDTVNSAGIRWPDFKLKVKA